MKQLAFYLILGVFVILSASCSTPGYFHDPLSKERQQELRNARSGNVFSDIFIGVSTAMLSATLDTDIEFEANDRSFKKLKLENTSNDTMYVNMLSDLYWDENDFCDFMDIRIPPKRTCKVMVPMDATYNLYYSTTPEGDDDELLEIFTNDFKKLQLKQGINKLKTETN